jgi:hypothetical protein
MRVGRSAERGIHEVISRMETGNYELEGRVASKRTMCSPSYSCGGIGSVCFQGYNLSPGCFNCLNATEYCIQGSSSATGESLKTV